MEKREEMKMGKKESWKEEVKNKKGGIKKHERSKKRNKRKAC